MPPIAVHIEDPISPTQARRPDLQPQTQLEPSTNTPATNAATTTAAAAYTPAQTYLAARPGAVAGPGPTAAPVPAPTRTQPLPATDVPPPPRPGDVPSVADATAYQSNTANIPPPPKTAALYSQPVTVPPPQAQYSPPEHNLAPTHSTDPNAALRAGPTTVNLGPVMTAPTNHPPGYVQNAYAQELNPTQRASLEVQQESERRADGGFASGLLGSAGGHNGTHNAGGESVGEAWDAVKTWSGDAGKRASQLYAEAHDAAWKWIKKAT